MCRFAWVVLLCVAVIQPGFAEDHIRDFYQEPGLNPFKDDSGTKGFESIDPFSGNLQLSFTDISLPGNGGMDMNVYRVYNNPQFQPIGKETSPIGYGWTMHQGRVVYTRAGPLDPSLRAIDICRQIDGSTLNNDTIRNNPSFESPDGSRMMFYRDTARNNTQFISKENWRLQCTVDGYLVTAPNGTTYLANQYSENEGGNVNSWFVTNIEDIHGNYIDIEYTPLYQTNEITNRYANYAISRMSAPDGREINFNYVDAGGLATLTARLSSIDASVQGLPSKAWGYSHELLGIESPYNLNLLTAVTRPDGSTWTFDYWSLANHNVSIGFDSFQFAGLLRQVTYPYSNGGSICYQYNFVNQIDGLVQLTGNMSLARKTLGGPCPNSNLDMTSRGVSWDYTYDRYIGNQFDRTNISLPNGNRIEYDYIGFASIYPNINGNIWRIGLQAEKRVYGATTGLLEVTQSDWIGRNISDEFIDLAAGVYVGQDFNIFAPQIAEQRVYRGPSTGNAYTTTYSNYDEFGNPQLITETGANRSNQIVTRNTTNTYQHNTDQWILGLNNSSTLQNIGTTTRAYDLTNGDLDSETAYGITTNYTYFPDGEVNTVTDARNRRTTFTNYRRGIPQNEAKPEIVNISRVVSDYGTIESERNGRGFTTNYTYDGLNRVNGITLPRVGSEPVTVDWNNSTTNSRIVTRGNYQNIKRLDGYGRVVEDTHTNLLNNETITVTYRYDEFDRKTFQSYPNSTEGTRYEYDQLNRVTRIIHADNTDILYTYFPENRVDISDENRNITTYYYRAYGDPSQSTLEGIVSPENITTTIDRDEDGQPNYIWQGVTNGQGFARTYTYNAQRLLETETNPESGTTTYGYDAVGNLVTEYIRAGDIKRYNYDGLNRLRGLARNSNYQIPGVTYNYDRNSNVTSITTISAGAYTTSSTKRIFYDENDNVDYFTVGIDNNSYQVNYDYDSLDNLNILTYPSGQQVTYAPDVFGRPTQALPFVNSTYYYPSGQLDQIAYANGVVTDFTLDNRLRIENITTLGVTPIGDLTYSYDSANNVESILNALEPQYNRTMGYDDVNRLTTANGVWGAGSFTYDNIGNLTSRTINGTLTTFDIDGLRPVGTYDYRGNKRDFGTFSGTYDRLNQLTSANGPAIHSTPRLYFDYDGEGARIKKIVRDTNSNILRETRFVYDGNNLLGAYTRGTQFGHEHYYLGSKRVASRTENAPPDVIISAPLSVNERTQVNLDATSSIDYDGDIVSYSWVQVGGPQVNLSSSSAEFISFYSGNLTQDTVYTFELTITDDSGNTETVTITVTARDLAVPPPPVAYLFANSGDQQNTVTWPTDNTVSYDLYWSTSPDLTVANGNRIQNVSAPYQHTTLSNNTEYYYIVTATDNNGTSGASNTATATPGLNGWTPFGDAPFLEMFPPGNATGYFYRGHAPKRVFSNPQNNTVVIYYVETLYPLSIQLHAIEYREGQGWSNPELLASSTGDLNYSKIIVSDDGSNAALLYTRDRQPGLYARIYSATGGWGAETLIAPEQLSSSGAVADFDSAGNLIIAWNINSTDRRIQSIYYTNATDSWSGVITSEDALSRFPDISIYLSNTGEAVLISDRESATYDVETQSWSPLVVHNNAINGRHYFMFDELGNATLAWGYNAVYISRKVRGSNVWNESFFAPGPAGTLFAIIGMTVDPISNDALVLWRTNDYSEGIIGTKIKSRIHSITNGWGPVTPVTEVEDGIAHVIMDDSVLHNDRSLSVFWGQGGLLENDVSTVFTRTFDFNTGWDARVAIGTNLQSFDVRKTVFTVEKSNNGNMVATRESYFVPVQANVFIRGEGWKNADTISNRVFSYYSPIFSSINDNGNALAIQKHNNSSLNISADLVSYYTNFGPTNTTKGSPPFAYIKSLTSVELNVYATTVTLDGTQSVDMDGEIVSYEWEIAPVSENSPSVITIQNETTATPTLTYISGDGRVNVTLRATDNDGNVGTHTLRVDFIYNNISEIYMDAGSDQVVDEGSTVTLDGSASYGLNGDPLTYYWLQIMGPNVNIQNLDLSQPSRTFVAPLVDQDTTFVFILGRYRNPTSFYYHDTVTITVRDQGGVSNNPTVTSPADITQEATALLTPVTLGTATANDPEDGVLTPNPDQTGPFGIGTTIVTWSATDSANNTGAATQLVTITDTTAPVLTVPVDVTAQSNEPVNVVLGTATATDLFTPVLISNDAPALFPIGTTVVTWTATDPNDNSATGTQNVTVTATNALPVANAGVDITVLENTLVSLNAGGSTDSDGTITAYAWTQTAGPVVVLNNANTATPDFIAPDVSGDTNLLFSLTVTDNVNATDGDTVIVTVQNVAGDVTAPVVTPPANIVNLEATSNPMPITLGTASANDDVDGLLTPTPSQTGPFGVGLFTITWSATDAAGNTGSATQTVQVVDTTLPAITIPADVSVQSAVPLAVTIGNALATDLFTPVTITNNAPALFPVGITTVTWTATDANGNSATGTQTVTVIAPAIDTTPPVVTAPTNLLNIEATTIPMPVTLGTASANDDVDGPLTPTPNQTGPFNVGLFSIVWSATDAAGNIGTATQTVQVVDTILPVITVPADVSVQSVVPLAVTIGTATATDLFTPVAISNNAPTLFPLGTTSVVWTATDANGNSQTGTQVVTVTAPPPVSGFTDDFTRADGTSIGNGWLEKNAGAFAIAGNRVAVQGSGEYRDNLVYRPASENSLDVEASVEFELTGIGGYPEVVVRLQTDTANTAGNFTGYLLYIDGGVDSAILNRHGQGSYGTELATINLAPNLVVGDTYRLRLRAEGTAPVQIDAFIERFNGTGWDIIGSSAVNDIDPAAIITAGSVAFGADADTAYSYDNFARNDVGGTPPPTDTTAPTVTPPANIVIEATANPMPVTLGTASANDDVDGALTPAPNQTGPFNLGLTTITWSATDAAGNTGSATQTVTVTDTTAPVLTVPADVTAQSNQPVFVDVGTATATDIFTPVTISNDALALFPIGTTVVTWTATDANGNSVTGTQNVTVTATNALPVANAGTAQTVLEGTVVTLDASASSDADGTIVAYAWTQTAGPVVTLNNANTINPTFMAPNVSGDTNLLFSLTVTDNDNATDSTNVIVTVQPIAPPADTTAPVVTPPANLVIEATANPMPVTLGTAMATDNIDGALTPTPNQTGPFNLGLTTITWSATDAASNTGTATQTVTVTDTTNPVLTVPADVSVQSDVPLAVTLGTATATDVFTPVTITNNAPALFPVGITTVTWTATDANGNSQTGTQTVTVTVPPPVPAGFSDDFNRTDGSTIGNGWLEKNASAFAIVGNRVAVQGSGEYRDNLVYRPASENGLDVEASVEFELTGIGGYPEVVVRLQTDTANAAGNFTGYLLYMNGGVDSAILNRHGQGGYGIEIATINVTPSLVVGDTYRLRLSAVGSSPVQLDAFVERFNGTGWDVIGQANVSDADPAAIITAGSVGFSGDADTNYIYDNFTRSDLGGAP